MENNIEVGDYIRDRAGHIRKVTKHIPCYENGLLCSDTCRFELDNNDEAIYTNKWLKAIVVNHSKDIIDLIEENDVIEYKLKGFNYYHFGIVHSFKDTRAKINTLMIDNYNLEEVEILSILTHEQYERNCYRLEG